MRQNEGCQAQVSSDRVPLHASVGMYQRIDRAHEHANDIGNVLRHATCGKCIPQCGIKPRGVRRDTGGRKGDLNVVRAEQVSTENVPTTAAYSWFTLRNPLTYRRFGVQRVVAGDTSVA